MKFIIPAKCSSSRLIDKNWREFHNGRSLVEIKIEQLKKVTSADNIFVACEDESKRSIVENYGAKFLFRSADSCQDEMHWCDVVTGLIRLVPCDDDEEIAFVLATTPLFDDYSGVLDKWAAVKVDFDCILTAKVMQHYMIDQEARPVNFSYGRWHGWSQGLPKWYVLGHAIHIMKKSRFLELEYYIGTNSYVYEMLGPSIDIDHPEEFKVAQILFDLKHNDH